ncbi:hypothetical protein HK096_003143 [Nowakowskiella sp. JEL0078]|nr:hypothetical protein HK096_003143 [Nowakowskiella sp. JEL0078]
MTKSKLLLDRFPRRTSKFPVEYVDIDFTEVITDVVSNTLFVVDNSEDKELNDTPNKLKEANVVNDDVEAVEEGIAELVTKTVAAEAKFEFEFELLVICLLNRGWMLSRGVF